MSAIRRYIAAAAQAAQQQERSVNRLVDDKQASNTETAKLNDVLDKLEDIRSGTHMSWQDYEDVLAIAERAGPDLKELVAERLDYLAKDLPTTSRPPRPGETGALDSPSVPLGDGVNAPRLQLNTVTEQDYDHEGVKVRDRNKASHQAQVDDAFDGAARALENQINRVADAAGQTDLKLKLAMNDLTQFLQDANAAVETRRAVNQSLTLQA